MKSHGCPLIPKGKKLQDFFQSFDFDPPQDGQKEMPFPIEFFFSFLNKSFPL